MKLNMKNLIIQFDMKWHPIYEAYVSKSGIDNLVSTNRGVKLAAPGLDAPCASHAYLSSTKGGEVMMCHVTAM